MPKIVGSLLRAGKATKNTPVVAKKEVNHKVYRGRARMRRKFNKITHPKLPIIEQKKGLPSINTSYL